MDASTSGWMGRVEMQVKGGVRDEASFVGCVRRAGFVHRREREPGSSDRAEPGLSKAHRVSVEPDSAQGMRAEIVVVRTAQLVTVNALGLAAFNAGQ